MMFRSKSSLSLVFAAAVVLAGCIKTPKANGTEPGGPDSPPPRNTPAFSFSGTGFCGIFRILHPETINTFRQ